MKTICCCLCTIFLSMPAFAVSPFYTEAGGSYVALRGAHFPNGAPQLPSITIYPPILTWTQAPVTQDKSKWSPFVALGYSFSDYLGVRLSYQYIGDLSARTEWDATFAPGYETFAPAKEPVFSSSYKDDIHVLSLAPELKWPIAGKLVVTLAPEINWMSIREEVQETYVSNSAPVITNRSHNQKKYTLGASFGLLWSFTEQWAFAVRYKYTDLKPSFGRKAHGLTAAIHLNL